MTNPDPEIHIPDTVAELEQSVPDMAVTGEARKRGTCGSCDQPFPARACGPTHAIIKRQLELEGDKP